MEQVAKRFVLCFVLGIFVFSIPKSILRVQSDFTILDSDDYQEDIDSQVAEPILPSVLPQPCFVGFHEFFQTQPFSAPWILSAPSSRSPPAIFF